MVLEDPRVFREMLDFLFICKRKLYVKSLFTLTAIL